MFSLRTFKLYLAKKEVTKADVQRHLNASIRALSDVLESSYLVTLQRAVSAAIAGRTFSTQAAWWQILGLPICDTNIKRDCIFINSRSRKLDIGAKMTDEGPRLLIHKVIVLVVMCIRPGQPLPTESYVFVLGMVPSCPALFPTTKYVLCWERIRTSFADSIISF